MGHKFFCILLILLVVPVFFFIYQPGFQLGALGFLIGAVGMTFTPLAILFLLMYFIRKEWR